MPTASSASIKVDTGQKKTRLASPQSIWYAEFSFRQEKALSRSGG
ncbi:hypothetical protein [Xenorhabdus bovienii]|nr:hypothetical protein [Xenorhabdus bovienii]